MVRVRARFDLLVLQRMYTCMHRATMFKYFMCVAFVFDFLSVSPGALQSRLELLLLLEQLGKRMQLTPPPSHARHTTSFSRA